VPRSWSRDDGLIFLAAGEVRRWYRVVAEDVLIERIDVVRTGILMPAERIWPIGKPATTRAALACGAAIVLIYLGTSMAESEHRTVVALAIASLGGVAFVTFVVFLLLGYRADRQRAGEAARRTESPVER
jgi:hypothetical protein